MILRFAFAAFVVSAAACLSAPAANAPSDKPGAQVDAGTANCASLKIQSKSQFDSCRLKCKDDQREQQASCGDPNCQAGIGTATSVCLGKCDEGMKTAKSAGCYKEN